ncbi:MAG: triose-phosphate isomerase [Candidatus Aenigmarchaeota archaeon]|nr:triose-phosphate isomerase [Candidatus Aenigmarchaeota archaeon]
MKVPLILVNFKSYQEASAEKALTLAKICEDISREHKVTIIPIPQFFDLQKVKENVKIPVFGQHVDPIEKAGSFTGHVVAENLKTIGIDGTLINHSERKLPLKDVGECVRITRKFGLISVCCAATPNEGEKIARFSPDFIAIEPPELIGTGISVSTAKPQVVTSGIEKIKKINAQIKVLCGAGITTWEDVKRALELGTVGVLVASGIVKAENPKEVLEGFAKTINSFIRLREDMF